MAGKKARSAGHQAEEAHARITPERVRRLIRLAKVVGPAVVPLVAPYVLRAVNAAREGVDRMRARRLGVDTADLSRFTGHGARLHARLASAAEALTELRERQPDVARFVAEAQARLTTLTAAVRAAERMPSSRRRAAHRAVTAELDRLEQQLLRHLGV
jgi:ABC-type transporter Mla subunit MlaD